MCARHVAVIMKERAPKIHRRFEERRIADCRDRGECCVGVCHNDRHYRAVMRFLPSAFDTYSAMSESCRLLSTARKSSATLISSSTTRTWCRACGEAAVVIWRVFPQNPAVAERANAGLIPNVRNWYATSMPRLVVLTGARTPTPNPTLYQSFLTSVSLGPSRSMRSRT